MTAIDEGHGGPVARARAVALRAGVFLGFWVLLSAPDVTALGSGSAAALADLGIALLAVSLATWTSLRLWPPMAYRLDVGALMVVIWRFLRQSVIGGVDVARRVFDPRLPIEPGFVVFRSELPREEQRAVLAAMSSASPGTLAVASDGQGNLVYHCLDTRQAVAEGLRQDEQALSRVYGEVHR